MNASPAFGETKTRRFSEIQRGALERPLTSERIAGMFEEAQIEVRYVFLIRDLKVNVRERKYSLSILKYLMEIY